MQQTGYYQSPFGWFELKASYLGLSSLKLISNPPQAVEVAVGEIRNYITQLDEYFNKKRQAFDIPLDWDGHSEFHIQVWEELLKIPFGHTTSYSAIAHKLGNPKSVRAVGMANRNNPTAIVVPCHRVIAKNGDLQGYFYGLDMKRKLLELENPLSFAEQGSLF